METSATSSTTATQSQQNNTSSGVSDAWAKVDLQQFIGLLIAELQSQDPMDPMDNSQILQQISQIREISSNENLIETLESVQLGQTMATAGSLIGRTVTGLSDKGGMVTGKVDRVTIEDGEAKLHVDENVLGLDKVSDIMSDFGDRVDDAPDETS